VHLFDIVTQYRAIFTDDDLLLTTACVPADDRPNDSILFHGWVIQKVRPTSVCYTRLLCLQCFDAVGWAAGRASGL